ncbi:DDB1- and CUL4-associated factor 13-like [Oscarella lobularis]|uniref:DDB1- and CUL4-associated factor 13-like n=1 Tax=Oscarella lobularis TaxID=121494 RepID=UPI003313279F
MKVKVLSRRLADSGVRDTTHDLRRIPRNVDPSLHPLEAPREYQRALNATKLERVFAKPFVGDLSAHADGVYAMAKDPTRLSRLASGSCDGQICIWSLSKRQCEHQINAHRGFVRGLCFNHTGSSLLSIGDDQIIKLWPMDADFDDSKVVAQPSNTILGSAMFNGIDHHWSKSVFATCSTQVDVWDEERSEPIRSFTWGSETTTSVRFNPVERNVLASTGSDRTIALYDIRGATPLKKVVLEMRTNSICWNPMEAFNFTAANEDTNLYTFDMRRLDRALNVHKDHVMAVLDCDYSPTGREFVSGSYDKTIRIFPFDKGHSREVYHTKRMQRVFCVRWSADSRFIYSGSEETNIRIWKADASERLGPISARQKISKNYGNKLKEKFKDHPQIRRISKHRHVPKLIYKQTKERREMLKARRRKEENVRLHTKPENQPERTAERKKPIVSTLS